MATILPSLPIAESSPDRHQALTRINGRYRTAGKLYNYTGTFSVGMFPNRSQERDPETLRFTPEYFHDGKEWKRHLASEPINQPEWVTPSGEAPRCFIGNQLDAWRLSAGGAEPPYGLVSTHKSSQRISSPPRERGDTRGISSVGKRRVGNMVMGMHKEYGRACVGFGTLTLPSLSPAEQALVNKNYGRLNQLFFERLKRLAERCDVPWLMVAAYEVQEKRLERWGQVVLHTHFVFVSRNAPSDAYWLTPSLLTEIWGDVLQNFLGHDVPRSALTNLQASRGDTGRELAKYQTKGSQVVAKVKDQGRGDELPGQWWTASTLAKELDAKGTTTLTGYRAEYLVNHADELKKNGDLTYRNIEIEVNGRKLVVGKCGYFIGENSLKRFMILTSDDQADGFSEHITIPRVGNTPDSMESDIVAALANGDFNRVVQLVDQADALFPHPDQAKRDMAFADTLYLCEELDKRRERQRLEAVNGYNEHGSTLPKAPRLGA